MHKYVFDEVNAVKKLEKITMDYVLVLFFFLLQLSNNSTSRMSCKYILFILCFPRTWGKLQPEGQMQPVDFFNPAC